MKKFVWFLRLAPLLVIAPAALLLTGGGAVHAQDGLPPIADVRDLSVTLTSAGSSTNLYWEVRVENLSTITMRNVQVRVKTDPPHTFAGVADKPSFDTSTGIWTVPELKPEGVANETFYFDNTLTPTPQYFTVRAEIISSLPLEDAAHLDNNQAVDWHYNDRDRSLNLISNLQIQLDVNNRRPGPRENPVFTVTAHELLNQATPRGYRLDQADVAVKVALSEGLAFASTPSAPSGTSFSRTSPTTGVWRLGRGAWVAGALKIPARLSTNAGAAPPLNRRCLTAQIVDGTPPILKTYKNREFFQVSPLVRGGTHTVCLGGAKALVLSDGEVFIRPYTCDVASLLCPGGGTTALVAVVGENDGFFYPVEDIVFMVDPVEHQVSGPPVIDSTWLWSTGHVIPALNSDDRFTGVRLIRVTIHKNDGHSRRFTISDVTQKRRPGSIAIVDRYISNNAVTFYEALNPDKTDKLVDAIGDDWNNFRYPHLVLFSEPGVYKVNFGIEYTLKSDGSMFSESATLTFVVGVVSDLQVHDAGLHGTLPEGQQAYTLRAENNQDGTVEQVEVALSGVPRGATAEVSSDGGRYDHGACDANGLCEGIWKIGDLEGRDDRYFSGRSDGPVLTLLVDGDDPKPITATITSDQTRRVTAGGQDYTYGVTDIDDSNSKDVSVAVGTGRGELDPDAPKSLRVDQLGRIALLRWDAVEKVSRWPVAHYQVQRGNQVLDVEAKEPLYLDLRAGGGNSVYRVRAVSDQGIAGAWSRPAGGTDVLAETAALGAPTGLAATPGVGDAARIDLSWFAPSGETGLRYVIEHAADSPGPWTTLAHGYSGTTYSHTGAILLPGTTHYYRVAAARGSDTGPWAYVQATLAAAADGTVFYAPGWPENLRFTSLERTAVTLAWDPPADDGGSRITGYEYRVSGPCPSGADDVCDIVAPRRVSGTSVRISGLIRESPPPYQFEVRALNAVGASDWSQPITKDVGPATAGGGRVTFSPSRLTVAEGGEATYRVKLSRAPTLPLYVVLHPDGDGYDNLAGNLHSQQFKILLPSGYDTSGLTNDWCDGNSIRFDWNEAYAWNVGAPITVVAAEDDDSDHETMTIRHTLYTVPADCLGMTEDEWAPDPVYDDMHGIALTVTERDND